MLIQVDISNKVRSTVILIFHHSISSNNITSISVSSTHYHVTLNSELSMKKSVNLQRYYLKSRDLVSSDPCLIIMQIYHLNTGVNTSHLATAWLLLLQPSFILFQLTHSKLRICWKQEMKCDKTWNKWYYHTFCAPTLIKPNNFVWQSTNPHSHWAGHCWCVWSQCCVDTDTIYIIFIMLCWPI